MNHEDFQHSLLRRQLRKYLPDTDIPSDWLPLLTAVDQAYQDADNDRLMLENSLELASNELLQRNSELRQLLDANPDLCLRLDSHGRILDWYGQADHQDFWGQLVPHQQFYHELPLLQSQQLQQALAEVRLTQQPQFLEFAANPETAPVRFYELHFVPLFSTQCLLMIRNTTERHDWEAQLEQRNRQLLSFHMMAEIIMTSGNLQEAYDRIVNELCELTGYHDIAIEFYDPERQLMIIQSSQFRSLNQVVEIPVDQTLSGLVATTGTTLVETRAMSRKEYTHPLLRRMQIETFVCVPLLTDKGVIGTLSLASPRQQEVDEAFVTWMTLLSQYLVLLIQRKQAEIELFESKKAAEAANQTKTRFLSTMSHELRTPLNSVLGFSKVLLKNQQSIDQRQKNFIERIHSNGQHLLRLINDVLDISRIEAGQHQLEPSSCDLLQLIYNTVAELEPSFSRKGLHWCLDAPAELAEIETDVAKLRQILTNLLNNAIKFTPESGTVRVRILTRAEVPWRIEVEDNGIGIPPALQEKIFEAFFQIDSSYARIYQGSGLGLAICRSLAQMLGYQLTMTSASTQGSCFQLHLQALD